VRVNIESSALAEGRFNKLVQDYFGGSRAETIGTLVLFWFDTQEREFVSGPRHEIISLLPYLDNVKNEALFLALLKHGYIKRLNEDLFEVVGNDKHVQKLIDLKRYGSNGGKKSAEIRKLKYGSSQPTNPEGSSKLARSQPESATKLQARSQPESATKLQARSLERNSIQCSSIQFNSNQYKVVDASATSGEPPVCAAFPTVSKKLFDSWLKTYQEESWINLELKKAEAWIHANPKRAPKRDFARFLNNWLSRGWDNKRKEYPSVKASSEVDIGAILRRQKEAHGRN
jgi:hypothetical protein